jgi:DNA/RNA endonuclease G (NUC1)
MPTVRPTNKTTAWRWVLVLVGALLIGAMVTGYLVLRERVSLTATPSDGNKQAPTAPVVTTSTPPAAVTAVDAPRRRQVGPPRSKRPLQVFDYGFFQVGYDNERRAGAWGRYELSGPIRHASSQPARPTFRSEPRSSARVASKDYSNPGNRFERGHIVPSYAMWSRHGDEARRATFVMVNVFPQDGDLNGRLWEGIEDDIAGQAKDRVVSDEGYAGRLLDITAIAGPIYDAASRSLPSGIPVPDACFYVIYDLDEATDRFRARAYVVPNQAGLTGPASRYAATIRQIEELTGLDFMPDGGVEADTLETAAAVRDPW